MPAEANLSPRAAERVCREAAQKSFDEAAKSLNVDWGTTLEGKQVQRWSEAFGERMVREREAEVLALKQGRRPAAPANDPQLLVVGVDGGRWQSVEENPETQSRWREDKVCTISSYVAGDGADQQPQKLVTTVLATTADAHGFGHMVRLEAERRGVRQAERVIFMGDCGNWIDPLHERHFACHARIADYHHAVEHLWEAARAGLGAESPQVPKLAKTLEGLLYRGKVKLVIQRLKQLQSEVGEAEEGDPPQHPRHVLRRAIGYFEKNQGHMDYATYWSRGWPIGSGNTEAGVKQVNKRVKGTEQFWRERGVESILALRGMWISQDDRWRWYWSRRPAYRDAA